MRSPRRLLIGIAFVVLCPLWLAAVEAQFRKGLGQTTTDVVLNRKKPPKVLILGTAIKVEVVSQATGRENLAQRLQTAFETQLLANDSRLRTGEPQPDTLVLCTISRLEATQTAGVRQVSVSRQTGTKQVYNQKKRAYETEPVYSLVTENQTYTTVRGDMAVSVQVKDRKSGATLDSQTFSPSYDQEFKAGAPATDPNQVEQWLIESAVRQAVPRLTPTREAVKIMLARPNDPIDDINKLGEANLWSRMLEQLEVMKPLADPKKEAYRLYNIGVANEALAYGTDDLTASKRFLEQASSLYGKALELKPDERYFRDPQTRIADAMTAYAELDRQRVAITEAIAAAANAVPATPAATGARGLTASKESADGEVFGNTEVIDMIAAGLDESNLLAMIKDAKKVSFDLTAAGTKQLLTGRVPNRIIAAMRTRQTAQDAPTGKPAPAAKRPVPPVPAAKPPAPAPKPPPLSR